MPGCSRRAASIRSPAILTIARCWRSCCRATSRRSSLKSNPVLACDDKAAIPTQAEIIARARALIPTLAARAAQGERERRIPKETIADMQAAGLFRVLQPKRWGGYEMDIHTY